MEYDLEQRLTATTIQIRGDHPFFGTLSLFTRFQVDTTVATAATDGKSIWINPQFAQTLDNRTLSGLVIHELLHAALQHGPRRCEREPRLWNVAADIVVNGIILAETSYALPTGVIIDNSLSHLSVEEVYEQLQQNGHCFDNMIFDLRDGPEDVPDTIQHERELAAYWRSAVYQAGAIARKAQRGFGRDGIGHLHEIDEFIYPSLRWRELLWNYVVSTPSDYSGFDRRFVWLGLYLDDVVGERVEVAIAIDTSGSVSGDELSAFLSEIQGMFDAYPHLKGELFFADTDLYGPYEITGNDDIPPAKGGGGSSFKPFFDYIRKKSGQVPPVLVYLTDGYGAFPAIEPEQDVIWVICSGGVPSVDKIGRAHV